MNSIFSTLYLAITQHLRLTVSELRWIDQDLWQLDADIRPAITFPAALIDFPDCTYEAMSEDAQIGTLTIQVKLAFATYSAATQAAPEAVKEKALQYFAIEQKVMRALHGWTPGGDTPITQPLIRTHVTGQYNPDAPGLRLRIITFTTAYEDIPNTQQQKAAIELRIENY